MIDSAYIICLDSHRVDQDICKEFNIKKRIAVDTRTERKAINRLRKCGHVLQPSCTFVCDYFSVSPGAVGCFLSHVKIWREISTRKPGRYLILEEDVNIDDVVKILSATSINIIGQHDDDTLVQLNKRLVRSDLFIGTESYCLTPVIAAKLIHLFESFTTMTDHNVLDPINQHVIECIDPPSSPVIWTAVDRFIQTCASDRLPEKVRIKITNKRRVGLTNSISTITKKHPHYFSDTELADLRGSRNYIWW